MTALARPFIALAAGAGSLLGMMVLVVAASLVGVPSGVYAGAAPASAASEVARREIPPQMLALYRRAALRFGIDWAILAGVGRVECDHGRDPDPSCWKHGAENAAGAGGPMQFLAATWRRYGLDGDGDGTADRWSAADAVYSAASYLRASGAPADYGRALLAYNDAEWYVSEVERWAARYRAAGTAAVPGAGAEGDVEGAQLAALTQTPVRFVPGERAVLAPGDGHVALMPSAAPAVVQAMVVAGNELQQLPYGPEGHPDPLGAAAEDCSSTVNYVLYRAGIRPLAEILRENPLAQDYVGWGASGPGRWVTIYAAAGPVAHVFIVIAGLRLDTSHAGTDVGPNRAQDGPRWRILDHIPTWAHWSVRHPPGL